MSYKKKLIVLIFSLVAVIFFMSSNAISHEGIRHQTITSGGNCMTCHKVKTPGLYKQWYSSAHALSRVTCLNCHHADKNDKDAFNHHGTLIATIVTPKDCGRCHNWISQEYQSSHHAKAGEILDSLDAYLAHVTAGEPVAILGCENCHGSKVKIDKNSSNMLSSKSWPNTGIGRLNPDGSKGSCTPCHTRHAFSKAQARHPEACGKCHLGPDHPQKEIYEESKHGNVYYSNISKMNMDSDSWTVGKDYYSAPTCATCHLSATQKQGFTHDAGKRIAWSLRPIKSKKLKNWNEHRKNMKDVCQTCHSSNFIKGHFKNFDATVRLYDEKFAKPATDIMTIIKKKKLLKNKASFSNKIEWTYWELWHHEGRRARHGAAMMGPDYTWWHGFYEIAQHFYFKFLPEARKFNDPDVNSYIDKLLKDDPFHNWLNKDTAKLKETIKSGEFQKRYSSFFIDKK